MEDIMDGMAAIEKATSTGLVEVDIVVRGDSVSACVVRNKIKKKSGVTQYISGNTLADVINKIYEFINQK